MDNTTLPRIMTVEEIADYLRIDNSAILQEFENGNLRGFKIGDVWRSTHEDVFAYVRREKPKTEHNNFNMTVDETKLQPSSKWNIVDIGPFDFKWPNKDGVDKSEHYDKGYEATKILNDHEYTFKIGFGNRKSSGKIRRRVTIWLGNRAVVEFAGSNDYPDSGLLAGIIRLKNGKQLVSQRIPEEYKEFRLQRFNTIVRGPRASTGMAVIVKDNDLDSMLDHAVIRATWKELI